MGFKIKIGNILRRVGGFLRGAKVTRPRVPSPPSGEEARRSRTQDVDIPDELQRLLDSPTNDLTIPPELQALLGKRVGQRGKRQKKKKDKSKIGLTELWIPVKSSWITHLRFITIEGKPMSRRSMGFIDMKVKYQGREYRYGTRGLIPRKMFNRWRIAASKGRWWWGTVTKKWSPAIRLN